MNMLYGYTLKGEFNSEDLAARTGLASLINLAIKQLMSSQIQGSDTITLKTSKDVICFKLWGDFIIMVRGSSEKENMELIKKICRGKVPKNGEEIEYQIKNALKESDSSLDRFSKIWG